MSISTNISPGANVTVTLTQTESGVAAFTFPAVVSDVDSLGIYLEESEHGTGIFYPWSSIRHVAY